MERILLKKDEKGEYVDCPVYNEKSYIPNCRKNCDKFTGYKTDNNGRHIVCDK